MQNKQQGMNGWSGTIAHVDLTKQSVTRIDSAGYCSEYIGGLGIGLKLYWDFARPACDAFHPDSPLLLMTGPLAATPAPGASRLLLCGKSPCVFPEHFVSANLGGFFAAELKKAGYDGLVLTGRAETSVYLHIHDSEITVRCARHLWGRGNYAVREALLGEHGSSSRMLSIGPAGENLTRIGIVFSDAGSCASMGFGSVMGSKNLKAVVVRGSGSVKVADPEGVKAVREVYRAMTGEGYFHLFNNPITVPGSTVQKKVHCHGCPQGCWRSLHRSAEGNEDIRKCQIGNFYMLWDKQLHGSFTEASFAAPTMANDYGVCAMEMVFMLLWLDQCRARGLVAPHLAGMDFDRMGSREFLDGLLQKICRREEYGEHLAQGLMRLARGAGSAAQDIAENMLTSSGRAIAYGPKVFSISIPIYATEPRPFITELHEICEPLTKWARWHLSGGSEGYVSTDVLRRIAASFWGGAGAVDFSTHAGKARAAVHVQNRQYIKESLNLCDFAWPVYDNAATADHVGDPALERTLFSAVTGVAASQQDFDLIAERLITLYRCILLREGRRGRADDTLPEFMFVEREEMIADVFGMYNPELYLPGSGEEVVSRKGKAVGRDEFAAIMDDYYTLRGWDVRSGIPTLQTLQRLNLGKMEGVCRQGD
jgi:aldehyde:ferredoxin oxidoreductase